MDQSLIYFKIEPNGSVTNFVDGCFGHVSL